MRRCKCICRYKDGSNKYIAYDVMFEDGSVMSLPRKEFVSLLKRKEIKCSNITLAINDGLCALAGADIPTVSTLFTPAFVAEVNQFCNAYYTRFMFLSQVSNLELVFDQFLATKQAQGIVYSPMEQFSIYEYMRNLRSWDIYTTYTEIGGSIVIDGTLVTEGIFTFRCFVRGLALRDSRTASPFKKKLGRLKVINQSRITNMSGMFAGITADYLDLSDFTTKGVASMAYMFYDCSVPELDLGRFDTSKVKNMEGMFDDSRFITRINFRSFDTHNVENMKSMFRNCAALRSVDLGSFNTAKVQNMHQMFQFCDIRSWNISSLDTSNVVHMSEMFTYGILSDTQLKNFNTAKVTSFSAMFNHCKFEGNRCDLSNFDTSSGENFSGMFAYCTQLEKINISSFTFQNASRVDSMFQNCRELRNIEIDLCYGNIPYSGSLCDSCVTLEELTLKGVDFSHMYSYAGIFSDCVKLRRINLACKNLSSTFVGHLLARDLPSLEVINLKGSDGKSIAYMLKRVGKLESNRIKIEY